MPEDPVLAVLASLGEVSTLRNMDHAGKLLVGVGLAIAAIGLLLWLAPGSLRWVGRLPGDIRGEHFAFPIVTCLVISLVLTIVVNLVARLMR